MGAARACISLRGRRACCWAWATIADSRAAVLTEAEAACERDYGAVMGR